MNRRGFLGSVLALAVAPAIVRASSLMKLAPEFEEIESGLIVPKGNQLLTISQITQEALRVLMAQDYFGQSLEKAWPDGFGQTRIAMPPRYSSFGGSNA
jgi:hypothetical protein